MPDKIFISYRRDDAKERVARVRDWLAGEFGGANVFMDVSHLLGGQRFEVELQRVLANSNIFLAFIGSKWTALLRARQASGERDYVREEIAAALKTGMTVIPVLIDGAELPRRSDLPDDVGNILLHHAVEISYDHFDHDVAKLIGAIKSSQVDEGNSKNTKEDRVGSTALIKGAMVVGLLILLPLALVVKSYLWPLAPVKINGSPKVDGLIVSPQQRAAKLAEIVDTFLIPVRTKIQKDDAIWQAILKVRGGENTAGSRVGTAVEDEVLRNHEEIVAVIQSKRHLLNEDAEFVRVVNQYIKHVSIYKAIRASGDKKSFPADHGAPWPAEFRPLLDDRISKLGRERERLLKN